jgi:hypothetical protein
MTVKAIRVPEELWKAAQAKADANDEYVGEVIRRLLEDYVNDKKKQGQS